MLGALLALASAATFGLNNAAIRRGVLTGSVLHAMAITVPLGVPLFAAACWLAGGFPALTGLTLPAWSWLALAGVIHFVIGRYGNYRATQAIGAALSSPLQQLSVPIAVVLALLFLDEVLTPLKLVGFVLVMVGPVVAMRSRGTRKARRLEATFRPRYGEGFLWSGVAALGYGVSPLFIVKGLGAGRTIVDSLAGGLVSYGAASCVILVLTLLAGGVSFMRALDRTAGRWFLLSGLFVFVSQMFRYMALAVAPVSIVVPIQRLSVVFRVLFSWALNREHEELGPIVLVGIAVSLAGAIALTLSSELVLMLLPFDWVALLTVGWP